MQDKCLARTCGYNAAKRQTEKQQQRYSKDSKIVPLKLFLLDWEQGKGEAQCWGRWCNVTWWEKAGFSALSFSVFFIKGMVLNLEMLNKYLVEETESSWEIKVRKMGELWIQVSKLGWKTIYWVVSCMWHQSDTVKWTKLISWCW